MGVMSLVSRQRGYFKTRHRELLTHFEELDNVTVASATFEIVGFPPVRQVN